MATIIHRKLAHRFKQEPITPTFLFLHFALDMPLISQRISHKCLAEFTNGGAARFHTPTAKPVSISRVSTALCLKTRGNLQQINFFNTQKLLTVIPLHLRTRSQDYCCIVLSKSLL